MIIFTHGEKCLGQYDAERNRLDKWGVRKSKHRYKKTDSWGVDAKMLHKVRHDTLVIIHEIEERIDYMAYAGDILERGHYLHHKNNIEDYGTQIFLELDKWRKVKA